MCVEYLESCANNVIDEAEDLNNGENIEIVEEGIVDKNVMDGEEARDNDHPKDSTRSKLLNRTVISAMLVMILQISHRVINQYLNAALPVIDNESSLQYQSQADVKAKEFIGPPENPGEVDDAILDAPYEAEDLYNRETDDI